MSTKTINISLDEELLKQVDKAAKAEFSSRSDYIRESLVRKLSHANQKNDFADELDKFMDVYHEDLENLAKR